MREYRNTWISDSSVESIETYALVAQYCENAMVTGTPIRIHRRRFKGSPAVICCECKIKSIVRAGTTFRVFFHEYRLLNILREKTLQRGYYFANPTSYEEADGNSN